MCILNEHLNQISTVMPVVQVCKLNKQNNLFFLDKQMFLLVLAHYLCLSPKMYKKKKTSKLKVIAGQHEWYGARS